jgi:tRNA G37 N-methylase Trm5
MPHVQVYANDLNPDSVYYMDKNVELNRIASKVHVFRMDGREFVRLLLATPGGPAHRMEQLRESPQGESSGESTRGGRMCA